MILRILPAAFLLPLITASFYSGSNNKVVNLDSSNFNEKVIKSEELWLIEFYAPWCGHCKSLTPAWKQAAEELEGVVNVGAVDADKHRDIGGKYGVQGFPTIKIFGANKNKPKDYKGGRDASSIVDTAFKELRQMVKDKKNGGGSSGGSDNSKQQKKEHKKRHSGGDKDVEILTDQNFDDKVINSEEPYIIEFYAPWCGHCQKLEPEWNEAASEIKEKTKGKVKIAKVDCTTEQGIQQRFGIQGFPTIKVFNAGAKDSPVDYNGGRTASDVIAAAMEMYEDFKDPPELRQLMDQETFDERCGSAQLCIISVLPDILDDQAAGRNERFDLLNTLIEKYKSRNWEWFWVPAMQQEMLEQLLGLGGFGYPAMSAINTRKKIRSTMAGSFTKDGINDFLKALAAGRAGKNVAAFNEIPPIAAVEAWDGKDGVLPVYEDDDLGDFDWDDDEKDEL